jgi:hypothetical protein
MEITWKEFCTWMELLANWKLRRMDGIETEWCFDDTPCAGFLGIRLYEYAGDGQGFLRFRERPEGVFCQVNEGPWQAMPTLDAGTAGQILDRFIYKFEERQTRANEWARNTDPESRTPRLFHQPEAVSCDSPAMISGNGSAVPR